MKDEMINEANYQLTQQEWIDQHKQMQSSMKLPEYEATWGSLALADLARKNDNFDYVGNILQEFLFDNDEQKYLIYTLIILFEGYSKPWDKKLWNKQTKTFDSIAHLPPIAANEIKTTALINFLFKDITQKQEQGFKAFYSCIHQLLEHKADPNTTAQLLSLLLHSALDKADPALKDTFIHSFVKSNINAGDGRLLAYISLSLTNNADDPICLQFIRDLFAHPDLKIHTLDLMFEQAWRILKSVKNDNASITKALLLNNYLKFISSSENSIKDTHKSSIAKYITSVTESAIPTAPNQKITLIAYCSSIKNLYNTLYEVKSTLSSSFFPSFKNIKLPSLLENDPVEKVKSFMRKLGAKDNIDLITLPTPINWKIIDSYAELPVFSGLINNFWGDPQKGTTTEKRIDTAISIYLKCKELLRISTITENQQKKITSLAQQSQSFLQITLRLPEKKITEILLTNLQALYKKGWRYQPNAKDFYARAEKELLILLGVQNKDLDTINFIECLSSQNLTDRIDAIPPSKCHSILFNACVDGFHCGELLVTNKDSSFVYEYMTFFLIELCNNKGILAIKDYDISTLAQIYYLRELTERRNSLREILDAPLEKDIFYKIFPNYKEAFQELFEKGSITFEEFSEIKSIKDEHIKESKNRGVQLKELNFFTEEQQSSAQSFIYDERKIIFEEKNGYLVTAPFTTTNPNMKANGKQNLCGSIETAWGTKINFPHIDDLTHQVASGGGPVQSATIEGSNELGYPTIITNQSGHTRGDAIVLYHSLSHSEKAGLYLQGAEIYILDMKLDQEYESQLNDLPHPSNEKELAIFRKKTAQIEQNKMDMHCVCQRYSLQDFYTAFNRCSLNNLTELKNLKNILTEIYTENKADFEPLAQQALDFFLEKFKIFIDNIQKPNKKIILSSVFIKNEIGIYFQELLGQKKFQFASAPAIFFRKILENANKNIENLDYINYNSDSLNLSDFRRHQTKFNQCIESLYLLYKEAFPAWVETSSKTKNASNILLHSKANDYSYKYFNNLFHHYLKLSTATQNEITSMLLTHATTLNHIAINFNWNSIEAAQQQSDFIMYDFDKSMRYFEWLYTGKKLPYQFKISQDLKIIITGDTGVAKPATVGVYTGIGRCADQLRAGGKPVLIWNTGDMGYDDGFTAANDNKFKTIYYTPLSNAKIKSAITDEEITVLEAASPQNFTLGNHDYNLKNNKLGIPPNITDKGKHKLIAENLTRHSYLREYHPGKISPIDFFRNEEKELDLQYLHKNSWFLNGISDHQVFYNDDVFIVNLDGNTFLEHVLDYLENPNTCNPIDNQFYFLLEEYKIHSKKHKIFFIHNPLKSFGKKRNDISLYIEKKEKLKKLLDKLQKYVSKENENYKIKLEKTPEDLLLIQQNEILLEILKNLKDPTHGDIIIIILMAFHLKANDFIHGHDHAAYLAKSIKIDLPSAAPVKMEEEKKESVKDQIEDKNNDNSMQKNVFLKGHDLILPVSTTNVKVPPPITENKIEPVADVQLVVGNGGAPSQKRKRFAKLSHFMQNHGYVVLSTTPMDPVKYIFYAIDKDPDHPTSLCQGKSWFFDPAGDLILPEVNEHIEKFRKIIIEAYDDYIDFIDKQNTHEYALEMNLTHGNKGTHRAEDIKNFLTCHELSKFSLREILDILKEYIINSYKTALDKKLQEAKTYVAETLNIKQDNKQQPTPLANPAQSSLIRKIYEKMQLNYPEFKSNPKSDIWSALQEGFNSLADYSEIASEKPNSQSSAQLNFT